MASGPFGAGTDTLKVPSATAAGAPLTVTVTGDASDNEPDTTTIEEPTHWIKAEEYHQDYLVKHPGGYDNHYLRALDHAHRGGDVLQTIRIHANRGSHFAEEGDYEAALAELDLAIGLGELGGFASLRALALSNRGDVKFRIGDLDESIADLELSKTLYQRAGSQMVAYPVAKLGEVLRERGDSALARVACEEAVALSEASQDIQGLVHGLATLARVLAEEDPDKAVELAQRAVDFGAGMGYVIALLAQGWIALERGDRAAAAASAAAATEFARSRRDNPGLAEALELSGAAAEEPTAAIARLEEARAIWRSVGSRLPEPIHTLPVEPPEWARRVHPRRSSGARAPEAPPGRPGLRSRPRAREGRVRRDP